jgi:hypothetical protein
MLKCFRSPIPFLITLSGRKNLFACYSDPSYSTFNILSTYSVATSTERWPKPTAPGGFISFPALPRPAGRWLAQFHEAQAGSWSCRHSSPFCAILASCLKRGITRG